MNGSLVAPAAMLLTLLALRVGVVRPLHGFLLFLALWAAGGLVSLALTVRSLRAGEGAWPVHAVVATLLLGGLLVSGTRARAPRIHDLTTTPADPPEFVQAAGLPANTGRDLAYPHGPEDTPEIQRREYPDLLPEGLPVSPDRTHDLALDVAREMGWEITWSNRQAGRFEAVATTGVFRFVDDVAVRVRPRPDGGSTVDVRSTSRVGRSDMGANAARIRDFLSRLRERVEAG